MGKLRELKLAGVDQWEELGLHLCVRKRKLGQSWPFRTGPSCRGHIDKLIPKQTPTGSTVIPKIFQDALSFTGAVVENIEKDIVIESDWKWRLVFLSSKSC
jgi:hypothetical protein